jgi:hypothetical protein
VQLSDFELPATLAFEEGADATRDASYVLFIPPDPLVLVAREDGTLVEGGDGVIAMTVKGRDTDAIVTVNAAGQVTF